MSKQTLGTIIEFLGWCCVFFYMSKDIPLKYKFLVITGTALAQSGAIIRLAP